MMRAMAIVWLAFGLFVAALGPAQADVPADDRMVLHVFWSLACPVCIRQKPGLDGLDARFSAVRVSGVRVELMELSRSDSYHALLIAT